jgi:hypothetical protein
LFFNFCDVENLSKFYPKNSKIIWKNILKTKKNPKKKIPKYFLENMTKFLMKKNPSSLFKQQDHALKLFKTFLCMDELQSGNFFKTFISMGDV